MEIFSSDTKAGWRNVSEIKNGIELRNNEGMQCLNAGTSEGVERECGSRGHGVPGAVPMPMPLGLRLGLRLGLGLGDWVRLLQQLGLPACAAPN